MTTEAAQLRPLDGKAATGRGLILEVQDLVKTFKGVHAVDGASFALPAGEITGLIGPNGAGKSTAVSLIAGLARPDAGRIVYGGREITRMPAYRRARLGLIRTFQLSSEFSRMTVLENLIVAAPGRRGNSVIGALAGPLRWGRQQSELVERAHRLLVEFGLPDAADAYAGELSGGQKRLLEIMRGVMAEPQLLLLDEPFAGVNPTLARSVEGHLTRLRDGGLTMMLIEHEMGAVERLCSSIIVMAQGRVLARGRMDELRRDQTVIDAYLAG